MSLELAKDGLYVAKPVVTFHYPCLVTKLSQLQKMLTVLISFKEHIITVSTSPEFNIADKVPKGYHLSLIHISEPTRRF